MLLEIYAKNDQMQKFCSFITLNKNTKEKRLVRKIYFDCIKIYKSKDDGYYLFYKYKDIYCCEKFNSYSINPLDDYEYKLFIDGVESSEKFNMKETIDYRWTPSINFFQTKERLLDTQKNVILIEDEDNK